MFDFMNMIKLHKKMNIHRPTSPRLRRTNSDEFGFTLVEILIVAPIVILVIGVFVSTIVNMTGEVLTTRAANSLAYKTQDALNLIQQDVKLSGAFLATNNIALSSPQGYNNDTTNFHNADATNGTMLILNAYTTTTNPLTTTRNLVYAADQPNACSSAQVNQNIPVMMNIIYFVKNNTLWRRIIMPSYYAPASCSPPWQQPSCAPGYTAVFCKSQDMRLVDGIASDGFSVKYYPSPSSITENTTASNSASSDSARQTALLANGAVGVTITAANTTAGRDISQSGTIRAVSPNNNVSPTFMTIKVLVVAGGGGGGTGGGGGGAGGLIYSDSYNVSVQSYSVTVGNGGVGTSTWGGAGSAGFNSTFDLLTAIGGGGGQHRASSSADGAGGSGGGTGGGNNALGGLGVIGQGHNGGNSTTNGTTQEEPGGGGGGAGTVGVASVIPIDTSAATARATLPGAGGNGLGYLISGALTYYAGGGGGSNRNGVGAAGGQGGGGAGGISPAAGAPNTGGGGGGTGYIGFGGGGTSAGGGAGIVIVSYPTGSMTATGGTITTSDGNTIHTFTGNGTFTVN